MPYTIKPPGERGPFWYFRATVGGRRYEGSLKTKDRASAELAAAKRYADLGSGAASRTGPVTFGQAADAYIAWKRPKKYDLAWLGRLKAHFAGRPCAEIRHADLVSAATQLKPKAGNATRNREIIGPAAAVLHYAAGEDWCPYRKFPLFPVPKKSSRRPADEATMRLLLANTDGAKRLLLALLYERGCRISEALRLRDDDLDLPAGRLRTRITKTEAGTAGFDLSPALVALFATTPRQPGGRVFPWTHRWSVYKWLRPLCRRLGVTYTPHQSRHAFATDLFDARVDSKAVADAGAWLDPRSPERYRHVTARSLPTRSAGELLGDATAKPLPGRENARP